jgi:hypothetical protein
MKLITVVFFLVISRNIFSAENSFADSGPSSANTAVESYRPIERTYHLNLPPPFNQTEVRFFENPDSTLERLEILSGAGSALLTRDKLSGISRADAPEFGRLVESLEPVKDLAAFVIFMNYGEGELLKWENSARCESNSCVTRERNAVEITVSKDLQISLRIYDHIGNARKSGAIPL